MRCQCFAIQITDYSLYPDRPGKPGFVKEVGLAYPSEKRRQWMHNEKTSKGKPGSANNDKPNHNRVS